MAQPVRACELRVRELDRPTVEQFVLGKRTGENESRQGQKGDELTGRRKLARGTSPARSRPTFFPAFAVMGLGHRVGESMALKWESLDLAGKRVRVTEQISGATEDGDARKIEIADALHAILAALGNKRGCYR